MGVSSLPYFCFIFLVILLCFFDILNKSKSTTDTDYYDDFHLLLILFKYLSLFVYWELTLTFVFM